jgi:hypothetical protein
MQHNWSWFRRYLPACRQRHFTGTVFIEKKILYRTWKIDRSHLSSLPQHPYSPLGFQRLIFTYKGIISSMIFLHYIWVGHLSLLAPGAGVEPWYAAVGPPPSPPDEQAELAPSVEADEGHQRSPRLGQVHHHRPQQRLVRHWVWG